MKLGRNIMNQSLIWGIDCLIFGSVLYDKTAKKTRCDHQNLHHSSFLIRYCNFDDSVFLVFKDAVGILYLTEWEGVGDEWSGVYLSCYESQHLFTVATIFSHMMMRLGCGILFFWVCVNKSSVLFGTFKKFLYFSFRELEKYSV